MRFLAAAVSNVGKVRSGNEDNLLFNGQILPEIHDSLSAPMHCEISAKSPALFGVFDGMGGHASGERASYLAAQTARDTDQKERSIPAMQLLSYICERANQIISAQDNIERRKMGTTAAMLYIQGNMFTVCNVGDSPIYLLRGGKLEVLSVEHTEKASYEKIFGQKAEPGRKFALTQCFGGGMENLQIEPHYAQGAVMPGDVFLLCSDGVTDMLDDSVLQKILTECTDSAQMVQELEAKALENGGKDNITAICVRVVQERASFLQKLRSIAEALTLSAVLITTGLSCGSLLTKFPHRLPWLMNTMQVSDISRAIM